jgi:Ca-activated chloride channel family protein
MKLAIVLVGLVLAVSLPPQVFRSNVDMVAIYPLVTGPEGRFITDLRQQDFEVFDNGKPANITIFSSARQPITALLLLDMSASMEDRWMRVRDAAVRFVDALEPDDRLRIGTFGSEIALSPHLSGDKAVLTRVLREELWPGGSTPLWNAMSAGMQSIAPASAGLQELAPTRQSRRPIVVVTDGIDTSSATHAPVADRAVKDQFMIYGIGLEGKGLSTRLVDLIGQTGGGHFDLRRSDDLGAAFLRLADELHHQYLIGFTPVSLDGQTHSLEVRVRRAGFKVRAPMQFVAPVRK